MSASLHALLPPLGDIFDADTALERFLRYTAEAGLTLYAAQEEALLEVFGGSHVLLKTPTGSGKSLVALGLHFRALCAGQRSVYTAPIKALVNEKFFALCELLGPERVGLLTGDASVNRDARVICCTAEVLANWTLHTDATGVDAVVMDEFHYYADRDRGVAWQIPLLTLPDAQLLLMSATMGDTTALEARIAERAPSTPPRPIRTVESRERPVPLTFEYRETPLHETLSDLVEKGRTPVYLVNFTQRSAAEQAQSLTSVEVTTREGKEALKEALRTARFDTPYGKDLQRYLRHGVGLHHAGLLPKYRRLVERLAQTGLLKVISGTDTLGVGVNIPIRTVLLSQLTKYNGEKTAVLSVRDFQQIAGRAGRKGFDDAGFVLAQAPEHVIENLKLDRKVAEGKSNKKAAKQKPPQGFVHYDRATFDRLVNGIPEPLESRFEVSHGMILELLQGAEELGGGRPNGYRRLVELILASHERPHRQKQLLRTARTLVRALLNASIVVAHRRSSEGAARLAVSPDLQHDFSLHHTLSLFLLAAIEKLDPEAESHALDVVSLAEAILEDPKPVLFAQLDRRKGELVAELKARGVEYEERMQELEKVTWPKPLADLIYGAFDDFTAKHPWLSQEDIRPKSVARELLERFTAFDDYVRDYGLQRSEGVLLRYLSEAYKVLAQNVPEAWRSEALESAIADLGTLVRGVDSSLLEEWEGMGEGTATPSNAPRIVPRRARSLLDDPRAFAARVRSELHALVRALAHKNWEAAQGCLHDPAGEWTVEKLTAEMDRYHESHGAIRLTPDTRQPQHTLIREEAPRRFSVQQRLFEAPAPGASMNAADEEREDDGFVECEVDLSAARDEAQPLIALRRVGS